MIKVFYPAKTEKIWHTGKSGNKYRLDSLERAIRINNLLLKTKEFKVNIVDKQDDSLLETVHSAKLIKSYKTGKPLKLAQSSGVLWQKNFYHWIVNASWTSVLATEEALKNGKSLVIRDGGHHAERNSGFGFGPINNMIIAANSLLEKNLVKKIAIIDLDVHYANGTHSLAKGRKEILSTDLWKYKLDKWSFTKNSENIFHTRVVGVKDYFPALEKLLSKIDSFRPDIIFYYMGLDVMQDDKLGGIPRFNDNSLDRRERMVSDLVEKKRTPICLFIGGGYVDYSGSIKKSDLQMQNLVKLFLKGIRTHLL